MRWFFPTLTYYTSVQEACAAAGVVLVLTEWREFVELEPHSLSGAVRAKILVDGRNCLDPDLWKKAGWKFYALGSHPV